MKRAVLLIPYLLALVICGHIYGNPPARAVIDIIIEECPDLVAGLSGPTVVAVPEQGIGSLLSATIKNQGFVSAEPFTVGFYLSRDASISTSDILLVNGQKSVPGLHATNIVELDISTLQIPADTPPGDYFLGMIVDETSAVDECDRSNNIGAIAIRVEQSECFDADLWTEIDDFGYEREGNVVYTWVIHTVFNTGQSPADSFTTGAYISADESIDLFIPGTQNIVPGLNPGESVTLVLESTFELPFDAPFFHIAFLKVVVDDFDEVFECDESNNRETLPLCELPLITDELRLILPWVTLLSTAESTFLRIKMEMELVSWKDSAAFELTALDAIPLDNGGNLCDQVMITPQGLIHIPHIRFTTRGIVALTADLRYVSFGERSIFEIVDLEVLP